MMDAYLPAGCETGLRFGLNPLNKLCAARYS